MRRVHTEILVQAASDLALENVVGTIDEAQDLDGFRQVLGPVEWVLPAGATDSAMAFPAGATTMRFLAIVDVDAYDGVTVTLTIGGVDQDVLLVPPRETGATGEMYLTTQATAVKFTNPSATAESSFKVMAGFTTP